MSFVLAGILTRSIVGAEALRQVDRGYQLRSIDMPLGDRWGGDPNE